MPHVEDGDAAGEQVFCFFSQELSDAHRSRFSCVVAVHEYDWSALRSMFLVCKFLLGISTGNELFNHVVTLPIQ